MHDSARIVEQVAATFAESDAIAHKGPGQKLHVTYDIARQLPGYTEKDGVTSAAFADRIIEHMKKK